MQDAGNGLGEGGLVPLVTVSRLALCSLLAHVFRVGQNVICTVYIRYFWAGNDQLWVKYGVYMYI